MIRQVIEIVALALAAIGGTAGLASLFKIGPERRKMHAAAFRAGSTRSGCCPAFTSTGSRL